MQWPQQRLHDPWFNVHTSLVYRLRIIKQSQALGRLLGCHFNGSTNSLDTMADWTSTQYYPESPLDPTRPQLILLLPLTSEDNPVTVTLAEMSQYLRPLSVPSRHNSTCDESPYSSPQSSPSAACLTPCSAQSESGRYFLNIPGLQTQQSIKDADGVDKLANAAVSQGTSRRRGGNTFGTYISFNHRNHTLRRCYGHETSNIVHSLVTIPL